MDKNQRKIFSYCFCLSVPEFLDLKMTSMFRCKAYAVNMNSQLKENIEFVLSVFLDVGAKPLHKLSQDIRTGERSLILALH